VGRFMFAALELRERDDGSGEAAGP
jgi:hypothetical protein